MSEDAVFDRSERMFNRASAQSHRLRRNAFLDPFIPVRNISKSRIVICGPIPDDEKGFVVTDPVDALRI